MNSSILETTAKAFDSYLRKNLELLPTGTKPADFDSVAAQHYTAVLQGKSLDGTGSP
jgi:cysteinyl-tRNA synthetase